MHSTPSTTEIVKENKKRNFYIARLERYTKDVLQFSIFLDSYSCEPQTQALFEQKSYLKHELNSLKKTNKEIVHAMRKNLEPVKDQMDRIKGQMQALDQLQKNLKIYSLSVNNHSKIEI